MDSQDWNVCPGPDVQYQWNLEALSCIASKLSEAFNRVYECGDKDMDDYLNDMRKIYENALFMASYLNWEIIDLKVIKSPFP